MKSILTIFALFFSSLSVANDHITLDDVNKNLDYQGEYIFPMHDQKIWWDAYNDPARSDGSGGKKKYERIYARNTNAQALNKSTEDWICSVGELGGEYHRGLKGIVINVYDSGGWWYIKASSYNSDNWASAVCWER